VSCGFVSGLRCGIRFCEKSWRKTGSMIKTMSHVGMAVENLPQARNFFDDKTIRDNPEKG